MFKLIVGVMITLSVTSCSDTTDTETQRSTDNTALESIDSSAIINDSTRLPLDSTTTTVTH